MAEGGSDSGNGNGGSVLPANHNVSAVSIKVPVFWKANPALWFCQLEAQFENSHITVDRTKYNTAVMSIDSSVLSQVSDVVLNPPANEMYDTLKKRLLERYADSDDARLKKLLTGMSLGDKKPSHLLREMREYSGNVTGRGLGEDALKSLWLQRLSTQCQAILSTSTETLEKIAIMADKIYEVSGPEICSISNSAVASTVNDKKIEVSLMDKIDFLCKQVSQIEVLNKQVAELKRSRSQSRSTDNNSRARSKSGKDSSLCWYHSKFADKALRCRAGCKLFDSFSVQHSEN